jgi:putative transposase
MQNGHRTSSHAVFNLKLHIVFVTKYRRKTLTPELLAYLREVLGDCLAAWRCKLLEFGGEEDHVHLLVDIHPALNISVLINNLKTASARRSRARFADHLCNFYSLDATFAKIGAVFEVSTRGGGADSPAVSPVRDL